MLIPKNYNGVLLFDDAIPKAHVKLSTERKALFKQIILLVQTNLGKMISRETENQRLISVFIILLNLESNTHTNANLVYKYFRLYQLSMDGKLITCKGEYKNKNKDIQLIGMDNYSKTTCYLDALLVAMFYSNPSFDYLLDKSIDPNLSPAFQNQIDRLKIILRLIINLLRSGEHIIVNIMYQLLLVLNSLGCDMALSGKQQDSLQVFEFLAESLSLPLLTLKLDIIHTGKLNVNDDLRLIGERSLLISIPTSSSSLDSSITLEECLNTYFNNSVTVRRHIDQKLNMSVTALGKSRLQHNNNSNSNNGNGNGNVNTSICSSNNSSSNNILNNIINQACESACNSEESSIENKTDIDEYEKMGILKSANSILTQIPSSSPMINTTSSSISTSITTPYSSQLQSTPDPISITPQGSASPYNVIYTLNESQNTTTKSTLIRTPSNPDSSVLDFESSIGVPHSKPSTPLRTATDSSLVEYSPTNNLQQTDSATLDSVVFGSFKNVNEKLERQRTRSSTLASVLNNVQVTNPTKLTRRSSSISNTEVSLPAWMYLQLLPYYTDPEVKLTVENHEEYYRRRVSRTKTIDSTQNQPLGLTPDNSSVNENEPIEDNQSYFSKRYSSKRPIVPICLKRYIWNERGQSIKIKRKVTIPEIIKYPYFIAEDKKKPGYVDFRRSYDHKAPRGSFMLVLQSCVCHRGNSVNSGHYVSMVRKKQFDVLNMDSKSEWIIFNDIEIGKEKAKSCTFEEAMNTESPYILFYEIYEIKNDYGNYQTPIGAKGSYWNRKQSIHSGISGYSEQTLHEEPSQYLHSSSSLPQSSQQLVQENIKSSPSITAQPTPAKHNMMYLSLAGLTLSKSRSKNVNNDFDDVLEEYYWYDDKSISNTKSNYSLTTNLSSQKDISINASNVTGVGSSSVGHSSSYSSSNHSLFNYPVDEDVPQIHVMEIEGSSATNVTGSTNINGEIEYTESLNDDNEGTNAKSLPYDNVQKSNNVLVFPKLYQDHQKSSNLDIKSTQSRKSTNTKKPTKEGSKITMSKPDGVSPLSTSTKKTEKRLSLARKGTVKKLFKKVFS